MDVHRHTISTAQPPSPVVDAGKTFVDRDKRAFSCAYTADLADDAICLYVATRRVQTYSIRGSGGTTHYALSTAKPSGVEPIIGSFMIPKYGTTSRYWGWEMNSARTRT